ncbi:universal stress protein [bacterium]|nr:universal stress protein [bacterium]
MKLIRTKKILVAVDFSMTAWKSFHVAAFLSVRLGLELYLMHVLPSSSSPLLEVVQKDRAEKQDVTAFFKDFAKKLRSEARKIVKMGPRLPGPVKFKTIITSGNPARQIIQTVHELQPDLVVLGTHGLSDFFSQLVGGCAERVVQGSPKPVLVVPQEVELDLLFHTRFDSENDRDRKQPPKVLLPTDFSEPSRHALSYALDICYLLKGQLTILHVIERSGVFDRVEVEQKQVQEKQTYTREVVPFLEREMVAERCGNVQVSVVSGNAVEEIIEVSQAKQVQLIVMGTLGRNRFERLLLGSTTESVIGRTKCPVLTVCGATKIDELEKKYQKIKEELTPYDLQISRSQGTNKKITIGDNNLVYRAQPNRPSRLFLGYYSPAGLQKSMEHYGISKLLAEKGFRKLTYVVDTRNPYHQTVQVFSGDITKPDHLLIEFSLHEEVHPSSRIMGPAAKEQHFSFLAIDWVLLQNPRARSFNPDRPRLPGQLKPGLGIGYEVFGLFIMAMDRLEKDGLINRPEHFHSAFLYHERCRFIAPETEGLFLAINRDTANYSLAEISWAVEAGFLLDAEGAPFKWTSGDLLLPRTKILQDYFRSKQYLESVRAALARFHFTIDRPRFEEKKKSLLFPRKLR